uniref:Zinc finger protein n=1 Tax=Caenorhabditis tropicalis TaxID=1561998 RepID=A0A1I7TZF3_9PELO
MEIQTPMLHHNPYEIVKSEPPTTPKTLIKSSYLETTPEMVFGSFPLHSGFCPQVVAPDQLNNNNNPKTNANGRALAADRKRPYPCNLCASKFGSKMELEEHQNSHTGQKPFECDFQTCNARFNRRSTLWNHKRIHSDAKPFVCTVCQMTFKWKNSLKCHKDMHQRKNETSAHLDNDLRQLTYATAAKRKLQMEQEENGGPPSSSASSIASNPLITTTSGNKKRNKTFKNKNNNNSITTSLSQVHLGANIQPLQASALVPPSDHQIDLDTTSLDSLMQSQNQNILMQLYGYSDERHNGGMLSLDDTMLSNLSDSKSDSGSSSGGAVSIPLPMQINMLNFRGLGTQQLPPVHHLSSVQPSVSSGMDYTNVNQHEPRYTLTGPEMMLGHPVYHNSAFVISDKTNQPHNNQFVGDNCVLLPSARQEYQPFDYTMINQQYPMPDHDQTVNSVQQHYTDQVHSHGKTVPHEQW